MLASNVKMILIKILNKFYKNLLTFEIFQFSYSKKTFLFRLLKSIKKIHVYFAYIQTTQVDKYTLDFLEKYPSSLYKLQENLSFSNQKPIKLEEWVIQLSIWVWSLVNGCIVFFFSMKRDLQ